MVLTGLCGEGVGDGDGDEEKDRDLENKQRYEEGMPWCPGPRLSALGMLPRFTVKATVSFYWFVSDLKWVSDSSQSFRKLQ